MTFGHRMSKFSLDYQVSSPDIDKNQEKMKINKKKFGNLSKIQ